MAQQVEVLAVNSEDLSSSPGTQKEKTFLRDECRDTHVPQIDTKIMQQKSVCLQFKDQRVFPRRGRMGDRKEEGLSPSESWVLGPAIPLASGAEL